MSENMLKSVVRKALHNVGFKGCSARIYYHGGIATVDIIGGCTGLYSVHKGCFISWH